MADEFKNMIDTESGPSRQPYPIVPHDGNELAAIPKGIYVGGAGDITLRGVESNVDVVLKAVPAGTLLPVRARYVRATGTTATFLVALA